MSDYERQWFSNEGIREAEPPRPAPTPSMDLSRADLSETMPAAPDPLRAPPAPAANPAPPPEPDEFAVMLQRLRREERREWLLFAGVVSTCCLLCLLTWAWYRSVGLVATSPVPVPAAAGELPDLDALIAEPPLAVPAKQAPVAKTKRKPPRPRATPVPDPLLAAYEHYSAGRLDQSRELYEKAARRPGSRRQGLLGMAMVAQKRRHLVEAAAWYRQILAVDPDDHKALGGLLQVYGAMDAEAATDAVAWGAAQHPQLAWWQYLQGSLALHHGDAATPVAALERAVALRPGQRDYLYNLAVAHDRQGQYRRAVAAYRRALQGQGAAGFDPLQVQRRLQQLGQP